jgi:hypothetical protein
MSTAKPESPLFVENDELPVLFADTLRLSKRGDGMLLAQFAAGMPGGFREQTRLVFTAAAAKAIIDVLCEVSNHYPTKQDKGPASGH